MKTYPETLVKTWLFLAHTSEPKLANAKKHARQQLNDKFGSIELAIIYLEQSFDEDIEVVLV
ncbi:hypothetical protein [Thalassotalea hakodatensis]|uniref:hypothetical protein n=1 Tax=Thalassotalea hakodatensis TaxID=3030492 RepID=UPI002573B4DD|nr:hypothetical protein [Thalassotalea hakodatensis]